VVRLPTESFFQKEAGKITKLAHPCGM